LKFNPRQRQIQILRNYFGATADHFKIGEVAAWHISQNLVNISRGGRTETALPLLYVSTPIRYRFELESGEDLQVLFSANIIADILVAQFSLTQ
jgi:hypothetical protein